MMSKLPHRRWSTLIMITAALSLVGAFVWHQHVNQPVQADVQTQEQLSALIEHDIGHDLEETRTRLATFEDAQTRSGMKVVDDEVLQARIVSIKHNLPNKNYHVARQRLNALDTDLERWRRQLDAKIAGRQARINRPFANSPVTPSSSANILPGYLQVPILLYHNTPADFDAQMQILLHKGYTAIDLSQLAAALQSHAELPPKPIVITFDDGFATQMSAFSVLVKYHLKATFYIINAGEASKWCIGAGRHAGLPCGDAYLSWDQIRSLDRSGLITIASHTLDHTNLPSVSVEQQRFEIIQGKADLEAQIGHPVHHFAYPYGSYNAAVMEIVRQAGFATAVSTLPGTLQTPGSIYALHRSRRVEDLP